MPWSLYAGNKKPGTSLKWSLVAFYRWSLYRDKLDLKTKGRTTTWSLRTCSCFKKMVVKTGLIKDIILFQSKTRMHWPDRRVVRKQLDIMPTYNYVQNQGKLMIQSRENGQQPQFEHFFWRFWGQTSRNCKFFWKIGFIQIKGHI